MDYHATTPVDPGVLEAMQPYFLQEFGNAASRTHAFGWEAEKRVEAARAEVAHFIGTDPKEIVFTSGATESNNMALKGVFEMYREKGRHFIAQVTEHKSVLDTFKYLETQGAKVTYLPVDKTGQIDLDSLERAITEETVLISIMFANNEIGTIQPIAKIGALAKAKGIFFHCDAVQAASRIPIDVEKLGIDLLSLSAHKMYGPKGVGMLYVRRKNPHVRLAPLIHGGGHERGARSGTLNVPGIIGFGKACEIAEKELPQEVQRLAALRDRLKQGIEKGLEGIHLNGHPTEKICNNLSVSFAGVEGESLLLAFSRDLAVSSGSACTSASVEPSYVLKALGVREDLIHATIRFGLGRFNTEEEVDYAVNFVVETVKKIREMSPLYENEPKRLKFAS